MLAWLQQEFFQLLNVIMIDVVLAGDNAIIVGLAASRVAPEIRSRVIFWGIAGAVLLRVAFAGITAHLLTIVGLTLAGGILLLWVCWKMYRQLTNGEHDLDDEGVATGVTAGATMTFGQAVSQVILADVTMSLDNVLAVAGAAKGSTLVLALGLMISVVLMAAASHFIARLLARFPWVTWIGLLIVVYVALSMINDGMHQVSRAFPPLGETLRGLLTAR
jgi:YjbE family integral membrane protein